MQNFSFFEVPEEDVQRVLKGLNHAHIGDRRVVVEISNPDDNKENKDGRNHQRRSSERFRSERKRDETKKQPPRKDKPNREERGYTSARGPKGKDEWNKFFQNENDEQEHKSKK